MKYRILALCLLLSACTTAQLNTAATIAVPIAEAAAVAAGAYFGVPPSATQALILAGNSLWGAYKQAQAGQPIADGAAVPSVGAAIAQAMPSAPPAQQAAILASAAQIVTAKTSAP